MLYWNQEKREYNSCFLSKAYWDQIINFTIVIKCEVRQIIVFSNKHKISKNTFRRNMKKKMEFHWNAIRNILLRHVYPMIKIFRSLHQLYIQDDILCIENKNVYFQNSWDKIMLFRAIQVKWENNHFVQPIKYALSLIETPSTRVRKNYDKTLRKQSHCKQNI